MKRILIVAFVFALGILMLLAEKSPQLEERRVPALNDDTYHASSLKRGVGKHTSGRWKKANTSPVCFSAKNNQFGRFNAPSHGRLAAIKLVHLYGYVSCHFSSWSYWGCFVPDKRNHINVVITNAANHVLLPPSQFISSNRKWSKIHGYNEFSPELVMSVFSHPHSVGRGQELRLWYGEDLVNQSEQDNRGRACCDVYALYV